MGDQLKGKRVAILATDGFEQAELLQPKEILEDAGAETTVVSLKAGEIMGWNEKDWGRSVRVQKTLDECSPEDFDALLLPGGVMNPDKLRTDPRAVQFAKAFVTTGKPVGAICHGPWLLAEADVLDGRCVTSWPSLQTDLRNAGAEWVDEQVVTDEGLVTSRKPDDIPAFASKLIEEIKEGKHEAAASVR
ncbi:MAG TPA: type 1 glutamine amidotransferase domain-containing protein [Fimbriimonas sp.]|nr:type 1 glutamine amidotransferase domain-containing protein [Fimbriimonas sp.]